MPNMKHRSWLALIVFAVAVPSAAQGHGFGQRFDLPIPVELYMTGAACVVALSFVVMALFFRVRPAPSSYPRVNLLRWRFGRWLAHPAVLSALRLVSVSLFALVLAAGLFGNQVDPVQNIIHTAVWIIWWVGLGYFSALLGDIFALINPWKIIFSWAESVYRWARPDARFGLGLSYPRRLQAWPAVILFLAFSWVELVWGNSGGSVPANLALAILIYSFLTWAGMFAFGKEIWLRNGEAFSVVFGLLARFAPTEIRVTDPQVCEGCPSADLLREDGGCINCYAGFERADMAHREWNLRPYAVGLLTKNPPSLSMVAFTLLVLAMVTFDGFLETPLWGEIVKWLLGPLGWMGENAIDSIHVLGLIAFPLLFLVVYLVFCTAMSLTQPSRLPVMELARLFVFPFISISFAYHLAHYVLFLLIGSQFIIPLASDPFGFGWNLFGTIDYPINIGIINVWFVWYIAVIAIVVGHIIAVYLAHVTALSIFKDARLALTSQYPLLVLMIGYTMISLWILAQPIS